MRIVKDLVERAVSVILPHAAVLGVRDVCDVLNLLGKRLVCDVLNLLEKRLVRESK